MCRPGIRLLAVGVASFSLVLAEAPIAHDAAPGPHTRVVRVPRNDPLTSAHLAALVQHSPTAAALAAELDGAADTVLTLRAHPLLLRQEGVYGRGRFWLVQGHLYGVLEYQAEALGSATALQIIAHELAHALELATTARRDDPHGLRTFVLGREIDLTLGPSPGAETGFACAIGRRVRQEILGSARQSALVAIARRFDVALPSQPEELRLAAMLRKSHRP